MKRSINRDIVIVPFIGASLSDPHTGELAVHFMCLSVTFVLVHALIHIRIHKTMRLVQY